ncbi:MAG: T9SS type A sorting domain-containing protein [Saprospiraceae bacterium]|nr:T9SS type A sorting domain-containing protein [Saprospiraceae bacterium]
MQPNPASDEFTVTFVIATLLQTPAKITITSMVGQPIAEYVVEGGTESISLPVHQIPAGIYWVKLSTANKPVGVKKLIITK